MSIFTKIINKEIPSTIVFEDEKVIVIKDINPKAKIHLLIIPKKEIKTINDLRKEDSELIAHMFFVVQKITKDMNIQEGYQLHFNVGKKGGQEVMHVHMHLLSNI